MTKFIAIRLASAVPVLLTVSVFVFLLLQLTPGDPALLMAGDYASPEEVEKVRAQLGLDLPVHLQFLAWLGRLLTGDLGISVFSNLPIGTLIMQRAEPTISLATVTLGLALPLSLVLGILAAWRHGGLIDRAVMMVSVIGFSLPLFVLGYILIHLFAIRWQVLPVQGFVSIREGLGPFLRNIILPASTLSVIYIALIARITRTSMLDVLGEDFIRTARSKGSGEVRVLFRHALRNAAVPIVTMIGISVTALLSGALVVESVFNIPGVGRLLMDAVAKRDYPVIQGLVIVFSLIYVAVNILIDIIYALLNPAIRY